MEKWAELSWLAEKWAGGKTCGRKMGGGEADLFHLQQF